MAEYVPDDDSPTTVFMRPRAARPIAPHGTDRMWNPADVASFLRVSRSWVYQKAEAGLLPVIRMPGSALLRFDPETMRAYARGEWQPPKIPVVPPVRLRNR
jgi:hypothetical protein